MTTEQRYYAKKCKNLKLVMRGSVTVITTDAVTKQQISQVVPGKIIRFENYEYRTSDQEEIDFLDKHPGLVGSKNSKILFEKSAPINEVQSELVALTTELGEENVVKALRKAAEKKAAQVDEPKASGKKGKGDK